MADRRLVWNQVDAPDLSGASRALARANQSFTGGLDAAQGIVAQYGEGQLDKADNALAAQLAGLGSEAEFDSFVDGGGLDGINISDTMRASVLSARRGHVDASGVRARTDGTRAGTGIRLAAEGRTASTFADGVARRDFTRGNAGNALAAGDFARANGETVGPITERGGPRNVQYRDAIGGIESDGSGGYQAVGATHETLGRALGRYQIMEANLPQWSKAALGREVSAEEFLVSDEIQDAIFDHKFGGYVDQYGEEGAAQAWFGGSGGVGKTERTDVHGRLNIGQYGQQFLTNLGQGSQRESPTDAYRRSLVESGLFSAAEIQQRLDPIQAQGKQRTAEIAARDADSVTEQFAAANQAVLSDPSILTSEQMIAAVVGDERFTATENEERIRQITELAGQNPGRLTPTTSGTPELDASVANTIAAADANLTSTDQNRAISDIAEFTEDPAGSLTKALDLGKDGENPGGLGGLLGAESGFDQNQLRNMINDYAREFQVKPSVVAVAMRDSFNRDPFGRNTLENRFDKDEVEAAVAQLDQGAIQNFNESKSNNQLMEIELSALQTQAANLQTQIEKTTSPAQKKALQAQLSSLRGQVAIIEQRRQNQ